MKIWNFLPLCPLLLAAACSGPYTVTLNEAVVYNPNPAPAGSVLADANFQGCLNLVLNTLENRDPALVTTLACPSAGISSAEGIDALSNLEQLDLSGNALTDLSPLAGLRNLRVLSVRDNDIRSVSALLELPTLRFISLQGNANIPCRQVDELQEKVGNSLGRPLQCAG